MWLQSKFNETYIYILNCFEIKYKNIINYNTKLVKKIIIIDYFRIIFHTMFSHEACSIIFILLK